MTDWRESLQKAMCNPALDDLRKQHACREGEEHVLYTYRAPDGSTGDTILRTPIGEVVRTQEWPGVGLVSLGPAELGFEDIYNPAEIRYATPEDFAGPTGHSTTNGYNGQN